MKLFHDVNELNIKGYYLNPGYDRYKMACDSEIFIDKTEMILYLNTVINTEQRFVCVSRPRRFGKSMAANMLSSYYGLVQSRDIFNNKKLAKTQGWDLYLNKYNVIQITMTNFIK